MSHNSVGCFLLWCVRYVTLARSDVCSSFQCYLPWAWSAKDGWRRWEVGGPEGEWERRNREKKDQRWNLNFSCTWAPHTALIDWFILLWNRSPKHKNACGFSPQITNEQAWQSTLNTWISFWMEWLVHGKEIFLKRVVGFIVESKWAEFYISINFFPSWNKFHLLLFLFCRSSERILKWPNHERNRKCWECKMFCISVYVWDVAECEKKKEAFPHVVLIFKVWI